MMNATKLLPILKELNRAEKLYVMQVLVSELAQEEDQLIQPDLAFPIWSPFESYEAADVMLHMLREANQDDTE
jgi:hypothetical protein